jgi:type VI secretion system protein ImpG
MRIYEKMLGAVEGVLVSPVGSQPAWQHLLPKTAVRPLGFDEGEALLPSGRQSFQGYRLLQEYFAFPQRFHFVALDGLREALAQCGDTEVEITVLLNGTDSQLEQSLDKSNFALHCTPVINLFQRFADRISVTDEQFEYHVVVDRTRPMDYEVFQIESVTAYGDKPNSKQVFRPFYAAKDLDGLSQDKAFYQIRREQRLLSQRQHRDGPRSSYVGSEAYISIVDAAEAPYRTDLRQLGLSVWCTNRDLPLSMTTGRGKTDFILDSGAPLVAVRCLAGPSRPHPSFSEGVVAWRLLNHLSFNYLSLLDSDAQQGAVALRELLTLYCHRGDINLQRQIEGVRSIMSSAVTRRMPSPGPITYGRGLEITVTLDDTAFEGTGSFLLGAVLSHFFSQYVSINSFTETVIRTLGRGQIMRWPAIGGVCGIM